MKAGFARAIITPPIGTTMMGFGDRDMDHGCEDVHDDIYVRALYLEHGHEHALIMAFDLCFLGREDADRLKGAIGRHMDVLPRQILMNASHNHVGPSVGAWYSAGYQEPDRDYLNELERATVASACEARRAARDVTLWAGSGNSKLPMNRRGRNADGEVELRPNPTGLVYDRLPVCLLKDDGDRPVCLLFSVSAHPSMMSGWLISAEYPGVAMRLLDEHLGATASLFLQGVGGDATPRVIGENTDRWRAGTWELMEQAGATVAREVKGILDGGLVPVAPCLQSAMAEMNWPLQDPISRSGLDAIVSSTAPENRPCNVRYMWAAKQLERLDKGRELPSSVPLIAHGVRIGEDLRFLGIEGEAVAAWGFLIDKFYAKGITFPMGYTDGSGLYLPVSDMLTEGGYEVASYWEYGYPAPLARGMETIVLDTLKALRERGIE